MKKIMKNTTVKQGLKQRILRQKIDVQTESTMVAKTSLISDNQFNHIILIHLFSDSYILLNQINNLEFSKNFKHKIHKEQKTIQYLTDHCTQTRADSNNFTIISTYRQLFRAEHYDNNHKSKDFKQIKSKSQASQLI
ncbi:unnamed protein product [Paramecium sonneborni]|uniref:Uncharacterized protein n=1 Tax=Paramecium sonneborni TaxID=65129 RepID=A0A8S1QZF9_9CILI|nr:unnamed protein product [Paramecium sonneborni]